MLKIWTIASVSWLSFLGLASTATAQTLPNGIAAGDVDQTSAILWARSTSLGEVVFEYARDPSYTDAESVTTDVTDPTVPVKVEVGSLAADTRYFYRVTDAAGSTAEGSFRTSAAEGFHGLRFGVSGDWRGELRPYPAISNAPERELDFFVELGDTVYADVPSIDFPGPQARSVEDFRVKHNEVYSERFGVNSLADLRASTALLAVIDDHEVTNNFAGGAPPQSDPRFDATGDFINDTDLFNHGLQAFQEFNPVRDEFYGDTGDPRTAGKRKLYRFRRYGHDAAVMMVDERSFRDEALPELLALPGPREFRAFVEASFDSSRTMLGAAQLADLMDDLLRAEADGVTWKFVIVPEPVQNLGPILAGDRYEGYAHERSALLDFIEQNGLHNVVFVTADIHGTIVNNLVYQRRPGGRQIATSTFEISTGPVAYAAPFGPTTIAATPSVIQDWYDRLDRSGEDNLVRVLGDNLLGLYGYPAFGLQRSPIDAQLVEGAYLSVNTYGWTQFDIDAATQCLTVTTYGIDWYTAEELSADPDEVLSRHPEIVSQFRVAPQGPIGASSSATTDGFGSCPRSASASCGALGVVGTMSLLATPVFRLVHRRRSGRTIRRRDR
jgi:3-phytase/alkaline phosphatase D